MKTFIDLFCGGGGFHLALAQRGMECVFACDTNDNARECYEANFGLKPEGDIRAVDAKDVPDHDVLCAGFPCQPFSVAGKKKGTDDDRGLLFNEIIRVAKVKKPKVLLLENVPNILKIDDGAFGEHIHKEIIGAGYDYHLSKLMASDFSVPQMRRRIFWVCPRSDLGWGYVEPQPFNEVKVVGDILERNDDGSFKEYPELQIPPEKIKWRTSEAPSGRLAASVGNQYHKQGAQGGEILLPDGASTALTASLDRASPGVIIGREYKGSAHVGRVKNHKGEVKRTGMGTHVYAPEGVSPSLTTEVNTKVALRLGAIYGKGQTGRIYDARASSPSLMGGEKSGGHTAGQAIFYIGDLLVRRITLLEARRIMGWPDEHILPEGKTAARRIIGNGLVPACVLAAFDGLRT